jgi:hypothetical protein
LLAVLAQHALERNARAAGLVGCSEHLTHTAARDQAQQPITSGDNLAPGLEIAGVDMLILPERSAAGRKDTDSVCRSQLRTAMI